MQLKIMINVITCDKKNFKNLRKVEQGGMLESYGNYWRYVIELLFEVNGRVGTNYVGSQTKRQSDVFGTVAGP